jgi:hypothetical protein
MGHHLRSNADIQITDRHNVDKMTENVYKMTENVYKMTENVDFIYITMSDSPHKG